MRNGTVDWPGMVAFPASKPGAHASLNVRCILLRHDKVAGGGYNRDANGTLARC